MTVVTTRRVSDDTARYDNSSANCCGKQKPFIELLVGGVVVYQAIQCSG
jgi:hypothetical protein